MARWSGNLTDSYGPRIPLALGSFITGLSFLLYTRVGASPGFEQFWHSFLPALLISGLGMGLAVVPITTAVMNSVSEASTGIASGVNNTVSRISTVLVLATVGAIAILLFKKDLQAAVAPALSANEWHALSRQADKLAETRAPAHWPASQRTLVRQAVHQVFISTFNTVCVICAILSFGGTLVALLMIKKNSPIRDANG